MGKSSGPLEGIKVGERRTIIKNGRKITFVGCRPFGKGKHLKFKIETNTRAR